MERKKECSVPLPRKLLEGEHVEVRQKEVGLRGSWHLAKVVRVKHGRRVVEYEDLLTPDGKSKLQESIHLCKDLIHHSPSLRLKNERPAEKQQRGRLIRPIPPCSTLPLIKWKSGLLVDAFYESAWWEGILLDDMLFNHAESKVNVFFPDEGDELQILVKDLRVSQKWDEGSGVWEMCGFWPFYAENGKIDVSLLKSKNRGFATKLWRQKRLNGLQDDELEELKNLHLSLSPCFQKQLNPPEKDGESLVQKKKTFRHESDHCMLKEATNLQNFQDTVFRIVQPSRSSVSSWAASCCDEVKRKGNGKRSKPKAQKKEQEAFNSKILIMQNKHENVHPLATSGAEGSMEDKFRGGITAGCNVTRSILSSVKNQIEGIPLSRLQKLSNGCLLDNLDLPEEEKLLDLSSSVWLPNTDSQPGMCNFRKKIEADAQQAEFLSSASLPSDCRPCSNQQKNYPESSQDTRNNGVVLADCTIPHKVRIRQARLAAKEYLLNAGWTFDVRNRARGAAVRQEAVYVSPSGSRFFSLAAACRGLKSCERNVNFLVGERRELKLLSAYHMADDSEYLLRLTNGQTEAERPDRIYGGKDNFPMLMMDGKMSYLYSSPVSVIEQKKKKTEKQKKRKSEALDISSPSELKRKRGRPPLKKGGTTVWQESKGSRGRGGCRMQVLLSSPEKEKDTEFLKDIEDPSQFKKSTVLSWLMDKGILKENEPVSYINRKDGHVMKKGHVTREGVSCDCCMEIFTLSNFEAHAGSKLHRPSANTFLDDGRSISDCQLEACALQDVKENQSHMEISDETCCVCGDGGEIILCDHCPLAFHADCIGLEVIPEGDWFCPRCSCGICGIHQHVDQDLQNSMHHCLQCELKYHIVCADNNIVLTSGEAKMSLWFCNPQCMEIFVALRGLVGKSHLLEGGFAWTLLRSMKKDQGLLPSSLEEMAEHHSKLSVAHGVMQECFAPMIDPRTNINLISQAIYNRSSKIARLNYAGFYTILLERGDEVISVATIRVHGARLAEMPLVGTRFQYRRQGMCRRLIRALEEMLQNIGVERLILPAVPELLETWMNAFNFQKLSLQEIQELSNLNLMTFPGTTLLQKHLPARTRHCDFMDVPHAFNKTENSESHPLCKTVEDFFTMARASLDSALLDCPKRVVIGGSITHPGASFTVSTGGSQPMQPFFSMDPQTPTLIEGSNGFVNMLPNCTKSRNRFRIKHQLGSSVETSVVNKVQSDDDINKRVVIATTRSNRLVKSRRWVADGLKELKIAKPSKRTFATSATCSESAPFNLDCSDLFETFAHLHNGQGGYEAENFYVRTRRKMQPVSVESAAINEAPSGQTRECASDIADDSLQQIHRTQLDYDIDFETLPSEKINGPSFEFGHIHRNGLCTDQANLIDELREEFSSCSNFYSRRKKREILHSNLATDSVIEEASGQVTEVLAQEQTTCTPVNGLLPGLRTRLTVP